MNTAFKEDNVHQPIALAHAYQASLGVGEGGALGFQDKVGLGISGGQDGFQDKSTTLATVLMGWGPPMTRIRSKNRAAAFGLRRRLCRNFEIAPMDPVTLDFLTDFPSNLAHNAASTRRTRTRARRATRQANNSVVDDVEEADNQPGDGDQGNHVRFSTYVSRPVCLPLRQLRLRLQL